LEEKEKRERSVVCHAKKKDGEKGGKKKWSPLKMKKKKKGKEFLFLVFLFPENLRKRGGGKKPEPVWEWKPRNLEGWGRKQPTGRIGAEEARRLKGELSKKKKETGSSRNEGVVKRTPGSKFVGRLERRKK